jgi:pyridoxal phosphate enzyme (YggS family)
VGADVSAGPGEDPATQLVEEIAARGEQLRALVASQARRPVRVVAVTKGHPVEVARAVLDAGFRDLGENYAQELLAKAPALVEEDPEWHFIGRLQSNKVRQLAPVVGLWQSVDRASLVDELARRVPGARVLVQVDLAGLAGRGGCARGDAEALVERAAAAGLAVEGLMGVGVPGPPEASREGFRWLRTEADRLGLVEASMGMSGDLEVALSEGATMVRVGSALVGERPPPRAGLG